MKTKKITVAILALLLGAGGCTKNANNNPQLPPLTPEQKLAIAKIGAQTAAAGLGIAIDKAKAEGKAQKVRILTIAQSIVTEFNTAVADVTVIDFSNRATVRAAISKALTAADDLTAKDVAELNDPALQAEIRAAIAIARSAFQSFDVLVPVTP